MARKHDALDVVKMQATLTRDHWLYCLRKAIETNNIGKLLAWRYGMQVGLSEAANKGVSSPQLDLWVIKRIKNLELAIREIIKKKHPMPTDDPKHDPLGYKVKCLEAKRARDREYRNYLMRYNY